MGIGKRNRSDGGCIIEWDDDWHNVLIEVDGKGEAKVKRFVQKKPTPSQVRSRKVTWAEAAKRITVGVWKYGKATIGADPAEDDVVGSRRLTCLGDGTSKHLRCQHVTECSDAWCTGGLCCGKLFSGGKTCGCCLSKKVKLSGEKCPISKW